MVPKPGKNPTEVTSYRPISLLPILSKVLEKLLLLRLSSDVPPTMWIPSHQFGFRKEHSTIQQCHRLSDTILKAFEDHKYCTAVFLDISQVFDKVWHLGLLHKLRHTLPLKYFALLRSYLQNRSLIVSYKNENSQPVKIYSGVPQGSILGPLLYTLHTADIPQTTKTILSTFADDTAIMATHSDPTTASLYIQDHLHEIERWTRKWKLQIKRQNLCTPPSH